MPFLLKCLWALVTLNPIIVILMTVLMLIKVPFPPKSLPALVTNKWQISALMHFHMSFEEGGIPMVKLLGAL